MFERERTACSLMFKQADKTSNLLQQTITEQGYTILVNLIFLKSNLLVYNNLMLLTVNVLVSEHPGAMGWRQETKEFKRQFDEENSGISTK